MKLFREADEASFARNYAKTLVQTVVMWSIFLLIGPALIAGIERELDLPRFAGSPVIGLLMFVAGGSLGLRSGYVMARVGEGTPLPMDTARNLVVAGPYRRLRNPMAVAGTIQSLGIGVVFGSPLVFAATIFSATLWNKIVRPAEEADMLVRFGQRFADYRDNVPCWLPRRSSYIVDALE